MKKNDIFDYFKRYNVITKGTFIGKSGQCYSVETDLRNAFLTFDNACRSGMILYDYLSTIIDKKLPFLGVPETGTLVAFYLNTAFYKECSVDFTPNILRANSKEYQIGTNSVHTVLPLTEQKYILIEDDVVTGKTLCKYLKQAVQIGINIDTVVSIFGRRSANEVVKLCNDLNIGYVELFNVDEIERWM